MGKNNLPVTPQQYRRIPEYAEIIRYTGPLSAGVIIGWVHSSEDQTVEYVDQGHENELRPKSHLDNSTGYPRDDAPAFLILRDAEGYVTTVHLGDHVARRESGVFERVQEQDYRKTWQHHTEYDTEGAS